MGSRDHVGAGVTGESGSGGSVRGQTGDRRLHLGDRWIRTTCRRTRHGGRIRRGRRSRSPIATDFATLPVRSAGRYRRAVHVQPLQVRSGAMPERRCQLSAAESEKPPAVEIIDRRTDRSEFANRYRHRSSRIGTDGRSCRITVHSMQPPLVRPFPLPAMVRVCQSRPVVPPLRAGRLQNS